MEVADGIHRFGTRMVNWYLIERGDGLTLVDAGMRGYWPQLERAVGALGRKVEEVEAVVLTHAHADHVGFAHQVKANSDATVWVHERDAEPGMRRFPPFRLYLRPTAWPLLVHGLRNGLLAPPRSGPSATATCWRSPGGPGSATCPATASPGATAWPPRSPRPAATATGSRQSRTTLTPPLNGASWSSIRSRATGSGTS
jgi:Metallo-beta-lactamase superfamily